ncbi:uncharacterized protein RCC_03701 [Ramularia collo-cygni]|uniref:Apple domain-containing protein n=1 Tax=Ramularia collo-cygni TaxID=112498 RepID=A0A2D3UUS6_9PEZI|nr:uncharacterized protein RCC_03701 [Ramularia collo-cygni]CZT17865.1 uncharacterized protein RCC_03701 [Ramularia collo-cygni]
MKITYIIAASVAAVAASPVAKDHTQEKRAACFPFQNINGCTINCGIDSYGGDFYNSFAKDLPECAARCKQASQCVGFSYVGTECYMKGSLGVPNPDLRVILGICPK